MERKKRLSKIALAALVLAAANPMVSQAEVGVEAQGLILAVSSCAAHGCPTKSASPSTSGKNEEVADAAGSMNRNHYGTRTSSYSIEQGQNQPSSVGHMSGAVRTDSYPTGAPSGGYSSSTAGYQTNRVNNSDWNQARHSDGAYKTDSTYNDRYYRGYNSNAGAITSPGYVDTYRSSVQEYRVGAPPAQYEVNRNFNRDYNIQDYDYNRAAVMTSSGSLTETQLIGLLTNPEDKKIFMSMDSTGRQLALDLASQPSYHDKGLAVRDAHRLMMERSGKISR